MKSPATPGPTFQRWLFIQAIYNFNWDHVTSAVHHVFIWSAHLSLAFRESDCEKVFGKGGWGLERKITHSASGLCCGDKAPHSSKWKSMKLILALFENKEEAVMLLTSLETQSYIIPKKTGQRLGLRLYNIYRRKLAIIWFWECISCDINRIVSFKASQLQLVLVFSSVFISTAGTP